MDHVITTEPADNPHPSYRNGLHRWVCSCGEHDGWFYTDADARYFGGLHVAS
ncbi:hypothetical protein [Lentzea sp. NBRC 102530]|uniref:hypothetical protein n=1 Tax=Lentzea sp. NBRC 102530 TaxID=3032201 RepID=UPI0024A33C9B|nr:hypothetical protein [Lentzea sp. NBRC 102530]GLY55316.1 hypothetical protein Lesp01_89710 [Lentzea sp. NBRC 102530]